MDKTFEEYVITLLNNENVNKAYVLATFLNKVCVGYIEEKHIYFNEEVNYSLCTEVRIFNEEMEIRIVKADGKIYSKIIKDEDYNFKLNDEYMYISGNKVLETNDKFTVVEQVNRKIALPFKLTKQEIENGVRLIVRNYCDVDENEQVIITESRLVGFSMNEREE